ncbi:copper resistance protein NlpE N-terminal domain-containing protein [Chryseobacterium sp. T1]
MIPQMTLKSLKTIGLASLFMLSFTSCKMTNTNNNSVKSDIADAHNAKNSLDYDGMYQGTLPCADCEGKKTIIYINQDNTYVLKQDYLGKKASIEEKGNYVWDKNDNQFTLQPSDSKGQALKFFVGENTLTMLDTSGKKITGSLADHYVLSKDNAALLNKKWRIMTLYGKAFDLEKSPKREGYIQFIDEDNRFTSTAGCNQMNGAFKIKPNNQLEIGNAMSTLMACSDMSAEKDLGKVLSETKSFLIDNEDLSFLNKDKKVIAQFKVPMN